MSSAALSPEVLQLIYAVGGLVIGWFVRHYGYFVPASFVATVEKDLGITHTSPGGVVTTTQTPTMVQKVETAVLGVIPSLLDKVPYLKAHPELEGMLKTLDASLAAKATASSAALLTDLVASVPAPVLITPPVSVVVTPKV